MRKELSEGIYRVTFTKVNGDIRVLVGTSMPEHIDPADRVSGESKPGKYIPVYDIEKGGWRCFDPEKVISFERV